MSAIKLENVSKYYKSAETVSVGMQKVNLDFKMGEFVAVTGESGSGKSTLLNVISGLDSYEEGELYLFGEETSHYIISDWEKYRSTYVGFVFQNYNIIDSYSVLQNVLLALEIQGYDPKKKHERAMELIDKVGLKSHAHHKASKLSGGQKQRAVIARALAKDCPIIVADEPTGNLDSKSAVQVMKLLHDISKEKLVVVVTHDFDVVEPYATRKIRMHDGEVVEDKVLRSFDEPQKSEAPVLKKMNFLTVLRFAVRNLFSTPRRTFFLMLMQIIVMLAFTLLFATIQTELVDAYSYNSSSANINVPETRMLVEKRDGSNMTQADYDYLVDIREVDKVVEKGINFYNDVNMYVFNLDHPNSDAIYYGYEYDYPGNYTELRYNFIISGTDAASTLSDRAFEGAMPTAANQVIIDDPYDNFSVGDRIVLGKTGYYSNEAELLEEGINQFVVSGITNSVHGRDASRGFIYFSDEFLASEAVPDTYEDDDVKRNLENYVYESSFEIDNMYHGMYDINGYIDDGSTELKMSLYGIEDGIDYFSETSTFTIVDIEFTGFYYDWQRDTTEDIRTFTVENVKIYDDYTGYYDVIVLNEALNEAITDAYLKAYEDYYIIKSRDSYSISVASLSAGNRVIDRIDSDTYRVFYPASVPVTQTIDVMILSIVYNVILVVFTIFLYSIVHAVSRNTMRSRSKDFAIYRSIGAQQSVVARLVVIEQVMIAFASIVLMFVILNVIAIFNITISNYLTSLTPRNYIYLFVLFLLFGAWLGLRFNKRVFKQSVIQNINISKEDN